MAKFVSVLQSIKKIKIEKISKNQPKSRLTKIAVEALIFNENWNGAHASASLPYASTPLKSKGKKRTEVVRKTCERSDIG